MVFRPGERNKKKGNQMDLSVNKRHFRRRRRSSGGRGRKLSYVCVLFLFSFSFFFFILIKNTPLFVSACGKREKERWWTDWKKQMEGASFFLYFIKRRNIDGGRRGMKDEIGGWQKIITDLIFFFVFSDQHWKSSIFRRTFNLVKMITEPIVE